MKPIFSIVIPIYNSEKTLSELYDPDTMPKGLLKAHEEMDNVIELCYRAKPFTNDKERLKHLFDFYEISTKKDRLI